ncbi:MAG: pantetheine-phosphate adenylyltransferase [Rikenellaceae bacterium]
MEEKIALFPGSFDPFTQGHYAIVEQGLKIFDRIIIGVGANLQKQGLLSVENRKRLIDDLYADNDKVSCGIYTALTGDYAREVGAKFFLRGMRNTVDYEYERNLMLINQQIFPDITTVLLFTPPEYVAVSSSMIRELIAYGRDPHQVMPKNIDIKNYL